MVRVVMGVTVVLIIGLAAFLGGGHRFLCHREGTGTRRSRPGRGAGRTPG